MPKNFGKTALGAVHSNYKTEPCKNWHATGECKFGEGCSFYHDDNEKRALIDPLPNLPEGVTLPPMPEKLKNFKGKRSDVYYERRDAQLSPMAPMIPLNLTDLVTIGGFNPNKYMTPQPMQFNPNQYGYQGMPAPYGQPAPFQQAGQAPQAAGREGKQWKKSERKDKKEKKFV